MKLKRPLSYKRIITGALASVLLFPFVQFGITRWLENRRFQTPSTYTFPTAELAELDRLLQARFAVVPNNNFGMGRIGPRHEIFKPVTADEKKAIESLRRQNQEVVFYVAGRNYLTKWPTAGYSTAQLQGPVFITEKPPLKVKAPQTIEKFRWNSDVGQPVFQTEERPADLPTEVQLRASLGLMLISHSQLDHTATPDGQTYRVGDWQVAAVPVRATDQACVNCHHFISYGNNPRLGDPLGIALYAFRSTAGREMKIKSVPLSEVPNMDATPQPTKPEPLPIPLSEIPRPN